jgi:hypothetical protein
MKMRFFNAFAMISLGVGKTEEPFLKKWAAPMPSVSETVCHGR